MGITNDLWGSNKPNNVPWNNAIIIRAIFAKHAANTIQQPPNPPDLDPRNFLPFLLFNQPNGEHVSEVSIRKIEEDSDGPTKY